MFNLIIIAGAAAWEENPQSLHRSRVAIEYTATAVSERYKDLSQEAIQELKGFPTLFVTENESTESKLGHVTNIRVKENGLVIFDFEFDVSVPPFPIGTIESLRIDIDLGNWELSRSHWAIKDEPLIEILLKRGLITQEQIDESRLRQNLGIVNEPALIHTAPGTFNNLQVFIVHGHDEIPKLEMASFITSIGLVPIILHQQASSGRTIIEKIEHYSNVGFGIVLYTPCDVGNKVGDLNSNYRARQNVVFEHGFLIGKLGRSRVTAFVMGMIETPNDISGVVYVSLDTNGDWKSGLLIELRGAGFSV